jgi:ankyrin repeat protein
MALARLLLEHGADPNAKTRHGAVPLHECVMSNNVESVKLLLEFGVMRLFSLLFL